MDQQFVITKEVIWDTLCCVTIGSLSVHKEGSGCFPSKKQADEVDASVPVQIQQQPVLQPVIGKPPPKPVQLSPAAPRSKSPTPSEILYIKEDPDLKPPSYLNVSCLASGYNRPTPVQNGIITQSRQSRSTPHTPQHSTSSLPPINHTDPASPESRLGELPQKNTVRGLSQKFEQIAEAEKASLSKSRSSSLDRSLNSRSGSQDRSNLRHRSGSLERPGNKRQGNQAISDTLLNGDGPGHENQSNGAHPQVNKDSEETAQTQTVKESPPEESAQCPSTVQCVISAQCHVNGDAELVMNGVELVSLEQQGAGDQTTQAALDQESEVKDGQYYIELMRVEDERICRLCQLAQNDLETVNSEEVAGKLRAAVGKANLLLTKKFKQFQDLCHINLNPDPTKMETTCTDLAGFWDLVWIQIDELNGKFQEIQELRLNNWQKASEHEVANSGPTPKSTPAHYRVSPKLGTPKSTRSQEARKRLQEAKRAARQRLRDEGGTNDDIVILEGSKS